MNHHLLTLALLWSAALSGSNASPQERKAIFGRQNQNVRRATSALFDAINAANPEKVAEALDEGAALDVCLNNLRPSTYADYTAMRYSNYTHRFESAFKKIKGLLSYHTFFEDSTPRPTIDDLLHQVWLGTATRGLFAAIRARNPADAAHFIDNGASLKVADESGLTAPELARKEEDLRDNCRYKGCEALHAINMLLNPKKLSGAPKEISEPFLPNPDDRRTPLITCFDQKTEKATRRLVDAIRAGQYKKVDRHLYAGAENRVEINGRQVLLVELAFFELEQASRYSEKWSNRYRKVIHRLLKPHETRQKRRAAQAIEKSSLDEIACTQSFFSRIQNLRELAAQDTDEQFEDEGELVPNAQEVEDLIRKENGWNVPLFDTPEEMFQLRQKRREQEVEEQKEVSARMGLMANRPWDKEMRQLISAGRAHVRSLATAQSDDPVTFWFVSEKPEAHLLRQAQAEEEK